MAGAASVSITPLRPLPGYFGRVFRRARVDSDVLAHAVVFADGGETVAFVAMDVTMIGRAETLRIKELCHLRTGIPARSIFLAANHAHSAPAAAPAWLSGENPHPVYMDFLTEQVVTAITRAKESMRPARFAAANVPVPGIAFNRRLVRPDGNVVMTFAMELSSEHGVDPSYLPAGPVDDDLGYVWFEGTNGEPIACIMNFACHNHSAGSLCFHRDLFGRTGDVLRRELGADIPTPFLAGACGDVMWLDPRKGVPDDREAFTWDTGRRLAENVLRHARKAARHEIADIRIASRLVEVPDRPLADSEFCDDLCRGVGVKDVEFAEKRYGLEKAAVAVRGGTSCLVEIGAVSVGDVLAISTNPAELFVELGLEIKRRSPIKTTLISELTNGYCGYVPTEAAFEQKGYETHRGVYTSRLTKSAGSTIVELSLEMLKECKRLAR